MDMQTYKKQPGGPGIADSGSDAPVRRGGEIERWAVAFEKLLSAFDGAMAVRLHDGSAGVFGRGAHEAQAPMFTLGLRSAEVVRAMVFGRDPLRFADLYFRGDVDVDGDLFSALRLKDHLQALHLPLASRLALLPRVIAAASSARRSDADGHRLRARDVKSHSLAENREAIAFHYDLSNEFYALWLGEGMVYSCAYFESDDSSLEAAQRSKLDHICRKLRLTPGERLLDIGCGWGALIMHAAQHYGVRSHGITLSQRQFDLASRRIAAAGLQDRVTIELLDYRQLSGQHCYDKIASVGMFEHVGLKNLPIYFDTVQRLLKPQGLFLNHGITHDEDGWGKALSSRFINRYVFPDGELDTVSNIQRVMERSKFEILDVEALRPHYAKTLRHWVARLERQHQRALEHVNEATYRIWRLYMAASAMEFESGELGVYQIVATPQRRHSAGLALTRRHLYG
jgi:cyclopropane-fatty-acyl-phospholipid synthase